MYLKKKKKNIIKYYNIFKIVKKYNFTYKQKIGWNKK